ncbi:hypothetical protein R3W88_025971 [Solanum pinnatisectum]|uniref:Cytochrome b6-f complex subunit 6 n=1 Tax=Solanum pinnatisectum TaxID=50273 RepID=A0AAV9M4I6_9SOLN|nr:hypothetical protein R3W88_025971 [Solanum pinnatisectum]
MLIITSYFGFLLAALIITSALFIGLSKIWIWSYPTQPHNLERPACLDGRTGRGGVVPILYPGTSRNIKNNGKANTCT